jgi:glucan phosphoethanolaminetransferase (alkaline phosphatase superfamily)
MPALLNINNLLILLSYLALSAVPFFPLLFGKSVNNPTHILGVELVVWLSIWAVFKRPAWFHWLLLPAFLALPTNIYLNIYYGQGITTHHLGIIAETSPMESIEFLGHKIWLLLLVMVAIIAWWWYIWRLARKTRALDWNDRISRWLMLVVLAIGLGLGAYGYKFGIEEPSKSVSATADSSSTGEADDEDEEEEETADAASASAETPDPNALNWPKLPSVLLLPVERETVSETWPFGISLHFYDFWTERQYLSELNSKNNSFTFGAHQGSESNVPQVVVLVIGESSRSDRWEVNGYARNTNPLLKQEANLVSLQDFITPVSATRLSVPVIISRKPGRQSLTSGFSEKSLLTAFKEAGFKTYWLSNQISFGQFDTPISAFAKEADVIQFMNLGGFTDNSNFDDILLEPMQNALKDPSPKKLIVLHTLGNHWNYSHRHPKEFDKWQPSLYGVDKPEYTNTDIKPQLHNSYDNSILYTDWFLSQVISRLKNSVQVTSMMFVSDHGQVLYDGECNLAFHGHNTKYEFHIPAIVWYSDQYKAANPGKIAQLHRHRKSKLSTENVFHSLLDMANVQYDGERLDRSFFNSKFKRHRRYVDSHGWANYDNAYFKGDCKEVIDKGKPLSQK